jgi:hypothetical protein
MARGIVKAVGAGRGEINHLNLIYFCDSSTVKSQALVLQADNETAAMKLDLVPGRHKLHMDARCWPGDWKGCT